MLNFVSENYKILGKTQAIQQVVLTQVPEHKEAPMKNITMALQNKSNPRKQHQETKQKRKNSQIPNLTEQKNIANNVKGNQKLSLKKATTIQKLKKQRA